MHELVVRRYLDLAHENPDTVVLLHNREGRVVEECHAQLRVAVLRCAEALLEAGLQAGERVLVMLPSGRAHTVADLAVLCCGGVSVPVYETDSADQVAWIVENCTPTIAILDEPMHRVFHEAGNTAAVSVLRIEDVEPGGQVAARVEVLVAQRVEALRGEDPACIIYTSGTTGRPKGCTLSHANLAAGVGAAQDALPELFARGERTVLFLPLAHVFARVVQYGCLTGNVPFGYSTPAKLVEEIGVFRPTWLTVVPRVLEKVYASAETSAAGWRSRVFRLAVRVAQRTAQQAEAGRPGRGVLWKLCDVLVYAKLRAKLGGRLRYLLSGGAPLQTKLDRFFTGAGICVIEGYGLSETSAAHTVNRPGAKRAGTVGTALPDCEVRLSPEGEILLRGPNVFHGYWGDAASSAQVLAEGWLHTGDLGAIDEGGFLRVTGRIKELIVTSSGKNVAPAGLEEAVCDHPAIAQCVVVGDRRPFVGALISLDPVWLAANQVDTATAAAHPLVRDAVEAAVTAANERVSRAESIRAYRVLPAELRVETGELTPTLKLKRRVVNERYSGLIEDLYSGR